MKIFKIIGSPVRTSLVTPMTKASVRIYYIFRGIQKKFALELHSLNFWSDNFLNFFQWAKLINILNSSKKMPNSGNLQSEFRFCIFFQTSETYLRFMALTGFSPGFLLIYSIYYWFIQHSIDLFKLSIDLFKLSIHLLNSKLHSTKIYSYEHVGARVMTTKPKPAPEKKYVYELYI